jgi:hypothetical protein
MSKIEAVRKALEALGPDAKPAEIQPYVKEKFGVDMTPEHITTCKGTLKKGAPKGKAARAAKPPAARPTAATTHANGKAGGLTKIDAVKRALSELGRDAKPLAIKDHVKSRFGIDISADVASNYKKQLKKAKPGRKPAGRKPAAKPQAKAAAPKSAPVLSTAGVSLQDLGTVKELVGRVGVATLRTLIDLLAR